MSTDVCASPGTGDIWQATWIAEDPTVELNIHNAVLLRWPATTADLEVLQAPSVEGPWKPIAEPIFEVDDFHQTTVPVTEGGEFFRLMEVESEQP